MSMRVVEYYPKQVNKSYYSPKQKWCVVYQDTKKFNEEKKPFEAYYADREGEVRRAWKFQVDDDMALLDPKLLSWLAPELNAIKNKIRFLKQKRRKLILPIVINK